jgi:hypothetical protein
MEKTKELMTAMLKSNQLDSPCHTSIFGTVEIKFNSHVALIFMH